METVNQENTQAIQEPAEETKTYTKDEVNNIVKERLGRERAKYEGFEELKEKAAKYDELEEANKTELQKAQEKAAELENKLKSMEQAQSIREMRNKVAQEKGVPVELLEGETEEACQAQADRILKFAAGNGYPAVRDAGEPTKMTKTSPREQFDEWAKKNGNF